MRSFSCLGLLFAALFPLVASAAEPAFRVQEISNRLTVGYAVRLADINDDGQPDIVVVDTERVVSFDSPSWQMRTLVQGMTKPHNVSVAPYDIDGDGKLDLALAADWRPFDTRSGGTIQWLRRGATPADPWTVHPIGEEPTVHRIAWIDLEKTGRSQLIVVPLMGRGSTPPNFAESAVRVLSYPIPADPVKGPWTPKVLNEELHVAHNFCPADLDADGQLELIVVSFEGVSALRRGPDRWVRTLFGTGNQKTSPNRGASEVKHGKLAGGGDYVATIEPWHGFQVVVYTRPAQGGEGPWTRHVLDEELQWGHAVWCANMDADADEELVIGVRDTKSAERPCGVRIYDPQDAAAGKWNRTLVDPAGVAVEDLAVADMDADGRQDIVAVGRATKNVRIYWNRPAK